MQVQGRNSTLLCRLSALFVLCLSLSSHAAVAAPEPGFIELDFSDEVIYCSIEDVDTGAIDIKRVLNEGTPLTFRWQIIIEESVDYWADDEIGSITFSKRVVPDIVSRQWLLEDQNSGIIRRTASIDMASEFLTSLQLFPAIDRSLIQPDHTYEIRIRLYIHEGEMGEGWWQEMLRFSKTVGSRTFQLP